MHAHVSNRVETLGDLVSVIVKFLLGERGIWSVKTAVPLRRDCVESASGASAIRNLWKS